jgi:DNA-binding transcriptional MerR regulator
VTANRISRPAERSGAPAPTLRFYETAGGADRVRVQDHGKDAVDRPTFISSAKLLGLALEEILDDVALASALRQRVQTKRSSVNEVALELLPPGRMLHTLSSWLTSKKST